MRLGVAEISEHPIAEITRHEPADFGDLLSTAAVVHGDDLAHVLWVEARRERGRADKIAEHNSELAAFGRGGGLIRSRRRRCCGRFGYGHRLRSRELVSALKAELCARWAGATARRTTYRESRTARGTELIDPGRLCMAARTFHRGHSP